MEERSTITVRLLAQRNGKGNVDSLGVRVPIVFRECTAQRERTISLDGASVMFAGIADGCAGGTLIAQIPWNQCQDGSCSF
jgi:hypothetical protein